MIIRRLATAVRRQDWFIVLVEIAIVFVGIFLGLQADDWAEERQDRQREQAALERLFYETHDALELLERMLEGSRRRNQLRRNAVQFADSDAPVPDDDLMLRVGLNTLAQFPPIDIVTIAYDELKSSGQMQLIRSTELREQIARFHTDLGSANTYQEGFGEFGIGYFSVYKQHVTWAFNPDATTSDILLSTYDWDSLRGDENFIFSAIGQLRNQLVAEEILQALTDSARKLCNSLAEATGQSCAVDPQ